MLSNARAYMITAPHVATVPGLAIMLVALGFQSPRRWPARRHRPAAERMSGGLRRAPALAPAYGFARRNAPACTTSGRGVPWPAMSTSFVK